MEQGRTGTRYRLLLPIRGTGRITAYFVNALLGLMAAMFVVALAVVCVRSMREATSPQGVLQRLRRASTADDLARGRAWGSGTFRTSDGHALCYVEHQHYVSGKNGGWRMDSWAWVGRDPVVEVGASTFGVDGDAFSFDPRRTDVVADDVYIRQQVNFRTDGRLVQQCVSPGEAVFVDLCVDTLRGRAGACAAGHGSVITRGDGTPRTRIRSHASEAAGGLTAGYLLVAALALYLWRALKGGAVVAALGTWSKRPPARSRLFVYVGIGGALLLALLSGFSFGTADTVVPHYVGGYVFGAFALASVASLGVLAHARRERVLRAIAPVEEAQTTRLAKVGEGMAELAVRVKADAPTVTLPGHAPRAFVRVDVQRAVTVGRNVTLVPVRKASWPATVPVEDPSGDGVLELRQAVLDTRATFRTLTGDDAHAYLRALAETPFGHVGLDGDPTLCIEVEESWLEPGESLYLLGHIRRVEDPKAAASYRMIATVPVVSAAQDAELCVHAGNERSLLGSLALERTYLTMGLAAGVLLSAALVGAFAHLWSLA